MKIAERERERERERKRERYNTCCEYELSQAVKESVAADIIEENSQPDYLSWYNF